MWSLFGIVLFGVGSSQRIAEENVPSDFKIEVRIVEFKAIKGVTKQDPNSLYHLHVKPVLVVTPKEVASVRLRKLRGPTIENVKTGTKKHYPRLVVDIQLTEVAKLRLKNAIKQIPPATTEYLIITTVLNDKHSGDWTKYKTVDPRSLVYWRKYGPRISCTSDPEMADRLVAYLTPK